VKIVENVDVLSRFLSVIYILHVCCSESLNLLTKNLLSSQEKPLRFSKLNLEMPSDGSALPVWSSGGVLCSIRRG
jgi:hypothetical protein